jgi:hypothetical protein
MTYLANHLGKAVFNQYTLNIHDIPSMGRGSNKAMRLLKHSELIN